jgi:hypothetical protein
MADSNSKAKVCFGAESGNRISRFAASSATSSCIY